LWTGGGFVMPPKRRVEPTMGSRIHLMPPSPDRGHLRSVTPMGFAQAVYEVNRPVATHSDVEFMTETTPTEAGAVAEVQP